MRFPVVFDLGFVAVPAHPVLEVIGYSAGFAIWSRAQQRQLPSLSKDQSLWLFVGALIGAGLGAKLLGLLEWLPTNLERLSDPKMWFENKTIVGGLLGAWLGVELAKRAVGVRRSTGDAVVFAFIAGLAIGRVGCFLTGLPDKTVGLHSSLPWAVDFGDGPRHPSQLYEIVFLGLLGGALFALRKRFKTPGAMFRVLVVSYLAFRLVGDFWKPRAPYAWGLSAIQTASAFGMTAAAVGLVRLRRKEAAHGGSPVPVS